MVYTVYFNKDFKILHPHRHTRILYFFQDKIYFFSLVDIIISRAIARVQYIIVNVLVHILLKARKTQLLQRLLFSMV